MAWKTLRQHYLFNYQVIGVRIYIQRWQLFPKVRGKVNIVATYAIISTGAGPCKCGGDERTGVRMDMSGLIGVFETRE
jgi:hypothetical protein